MNILHALHQLLGGGHPQPHPQAKPQPAQQAPFKMYEDRSFQGNPAQFRTANPGYRFYEDNTFSPPPPLQVRPQHAPLNLGIPYMPLGQGGHYNLGFSPLQNSAARNPQLNQGQPQSFAPFNPQDNPYQQYWQ